MKLHLATENNIDKIMEIIEDARDYLKSQNLKQWNLSDGYPQKDDILKDIKNKNCYILKNYHKIIGVMTIIVGIDENYLEIYDGSWEYNEAYATIHRIAVKKEFRNKGIGKTMLLLAEDVIKSKGIYLIRIDTHNDNIPMNKTIISTGYKYCGIIKLKRSNEDNLRNGYEKKINK